MNKFIKIAIDLIFILTLMLYLYLIIMFATACETIKLRDVPVYKPLTIGDTVVCYYEVRFLSGGKECISKEVYKRDIEPYSVVVPYDTHKFFMDTALKACEMAGRNRYQKCSHEIKVIDSMLLELINLNKK